MANVRNAGLVSRAAATGRRSDARLRKKRAPNTGAQTSPSGRVATMRPARAANVRARCRPPRSSTSRSKAAVSPGSPQSRLHEWQRIPHEIAKIERQQNHDRRRPLQRQAARSVPAPGDIRLHAAYRRGGDENDVENQQQALRPFGNRHRGAADEHPQERGETFDPFTTGGEYESLAGREVCCVARRKCPRRRFRHRGTRACRRRATRRTRE